MSTQKIFVPLGEDKRQFIQVNGRPYPKGDVFPIPDENYEYLSLNDQHGRPIMDNTRFSEILYTNGNDAEVYFQSKEELEAYVLDNFFKIADDGGGTPGASDLQNTLDAGDVATGHNMTLQNENGDTVTAIYGTLNYGQVQVKDPLNELDDRHRSIQVYPLGFGVSADVDAGFGNIISAKTDYQFPDDELPTMANRSFIIASREYADALTLQKITDNDGTTKNNIVVRRENDNGATNVTMAINEASLAGFVNIEDETSGANAGIRVYNPNLEGNITANMKVHGVPATEANLIADDNSALMDLNSPSDLTYFKIEATNELLQMQLKAGPSDNKGYLNIIFPNSADIAGGNINLNIPLKSGTIAVNADVIGGAGAGSPTFIPYWSTNSVLANSGIAYNGARYAIDATIDNNYKLVIGGAVNVTGNINSTAIISGAQANFGNGTNVLGGNFASVFGLSNTSTGTRSFVVGRENVGSSGENFVSGYQNVCSGTRSTATGQQNSATNTMSHAFGWSCTSSGVAAVALSMGTVARSYGETSAGVFNTDYTPASVSAINGLDRAFSVGIGADTSNRKDGLNVMKSGQVLVPSGDVDISLSGKGVILVDTVTGTRYRVTVVSGVLALTAV